MTTYVLYVRINGDWEEVTRFEALDEAEGFRTAESLVPPEHAGRPIGLIPSDMAFLPPPTPECAPVEKVLPPSGTGPPSVGTFLAG